METTRRKRTLTAPVGEVETRSAITRQKNPVYEASNLQNLQTEEDVEEALDGSVGLGLGLTVNLGNMEFARVDVKVTLPCSSSDASIRATKKKCEDYVRLFISEEYQAATGKPLGGRKSK